MKHKAMYKCKLCGEVFGVGSHDLHMDKISKGSSSEISEAIKSQFETLKSITPCYLHECEIGCIGYADFLGFKRED